VGSAVDPALLIRLFVEFLKKSTIKNGFS